MTLEHPDSNNKHPVQWPVAAALIDPPDGLVSGKRRYIDRTVLILTLLSVIAMLGLTVNPWPRDGWYQTQYFLVGSFPGQDNYSPIAAPAFLYRFAHEIAVRGGLGLAGEFYISSVLQNLLVLVSACFVYYTLRLMRMSNYAGAVAIGFLLLVLSTGLPQAFWSENVVLFLMAAVVLATAAILHDTCCSKPRFWSLALACGFLVGMLVITRATPILLIPGIALLLLRRMPFQRVAQFTGVLILITALMVAGMVLSNHARFGRYELTNSSGRHLWNGVTAIADRALAHSTDYEALKKLDPHIQGKSWQQIPPVEDFEGADPREVLLRKLSKQAIADAPVLYLRQGAWRFIRTIGAAPYRLGFGAAGSYWNPLHRTDFLPPLATQMNVPAAYGDAVDAEFRGIYTVCGWLYPIVVFTIGISFLSLVAERLDRLLRQRASARVVGKRILPVGAFLAGGIFAAGIPIATNGINLFAVIESLLCALLLGWCASMLYRTLDQSSASAGSQTDVPLFLFLAFMFFGSLWFSWQVESPNPRNALPYLPFLSVMLAIGLTHWRGMWLRLHGRAGDVLAASPATTV